MKRLHFIYLIIFSLILFPWLKISPKMPELRPEWFFLIFVILGFRWKKKVFKSSVVYWTVSLTVSFFISLLYGMVFLNVSVDIRDFFELLKPIMYLLLFLLVTSISLTFEELKKFIRFVLILFLVEGILSIIQYFAPETISPILSLYTDSDRIILYTQSRATGTMGNANDLGMLNTIGFTLAIYTLRYRLFSNFIARGMLIIMFLSVMASGSRTAFICMIIVTTYFFYSELKLSFKSIVVLAVICLAIYWIINLDLEILNGSTGRYSTLGKLGEDKAWMARVYSTIEVLSLIGQSILFGWGPNKLGFGIGGNIDNEYILILYRYGIFGLIVLFGFFIALWRQTQNKLLQAIPFLKSYSNYSTSIILASMIFAYTAGIYMSFRIMMLIIVFLTISSKVNINTVLDRSFFVTNGSVSTGYINS